MKDLYSLRDHQDTHPVRDVDFQGGRKGPEEPDVTTCPLSILREFLGRVGGFCLLVLGPLECLPLLTKDLFIFSTISSDRNPLLLLLCLFYRF